ncbi:hypothetical protein GNI_155580 [Gregarina niphandrodes]|uniref:Uncharacterized protein n=1 Tax=Gregarina niphandrodes TaxID=110365 RepID=A0A023AZJ0_GRENI|nr:hypothetical protein GNI_155580 [Gregarina niphandrodes]EZG43916.1 hypothetical protein GNI_155580 [Gregarina niphandrodes]|eukprot:XP_011132887.1 hypothetical protein GNI_155580 [Gregarina niphandrodes]
MTAANTGFDAGAMQNQTEMYFESVEQIMDDESSESDNQGVSGTGYKSTVASKFFEDMIGPFAR